MANKKPEPLSLKALIVSYRAIADMMDAHKLPQPTTQYLRKLLDRVEAAVKRERERAEADALAVGGMVEALRKPAGNAAAMREALESTRNWCLNRLYNAPYQVTVEGLLSIVNAALAEPPRNCEKYATVDEAYNQFMDYVRRENPACIKVSPLHAVWDALKWILDKEGV